MAQAGLVFIGVELDEAAIAEVCAACAWGGSEVDPVSEGELWAFYPYLEDVAADPEDYWWEDWGGESAAGESYLVEPEDDPMFLPWWGMRQVIAVVCARNGKLAGYVTGVTCEILV